MFVQLLIFRSVSPDDGVEQPCASFGCQIQKTPHRRSKSRALDMVDIASTCPRTSGMEAGSRLRAQAPMLRGVAAVRISLLRDLIRRLRSPTDYNNKILTSARNGDLIMWDLDKPGGTKYGRCLRLSASMTNVPVERKTKNHIRCIHKLSCSSIVPYYCITGSADGDMRIWVRLFAPCLCAVLMSCRICGTCRVQ